MARITQPLVPSGVIHQYAGSTAPSGYLLCDGSAVSRTTYAALFTTLGTTYGAGDGSTTFNVPDLRGRVPMGAGTGTGLNASGTGAPTGTAQTARTRGQWGGEETHLLTTGEMPSHTHTQDAHAHDVQGPAGHSIATNFGGGAVWATFSFSPDAINSPSGYGSTWIANSATATNQNTGGGGRHAVVPPFVVTNYIIKT